MYQASGKQHRWILSLPCYNSNVCKGKSWYSFRKNYSPNRAPEQLTWEETEMQSKNRSPALICCLLKSSRHWWVLWRWHQNLLVSILTTPAVLSVESTGGKELLRPTTSSLRLLPTTLKQSLFPDLRCYPSDYLKRKKSPVESFLSSPPLCLPFPPQKGTHRKARGSKWRRRSRCPPGKRLEEPSPNVRHAISLVQPSPIQHIFYRTFLP